MKHVKLFSGMLLLAAVVGCSGGDETVPDNKAQNETETVFVDDPGPALTAEQETMFNENVNGFTFNMFRALVNKNPGQSIVSSPLSVAAVLAMLNDGAMGKTREELLQVLGFGEAKTRALNEYFQKQMNMENKYDTKLQMSNAVFARQGFEFKPAFVEDMKKYYDAPAEVLDFSSPDAVDHINSWCSGHTNGMIPKIVDQLSPDALSVLLNAIYFNGRWAMPFVEDLTRSEKFTLEDKTQKSVQMMHLTMPMIYQENDLFQALCMEYSDAGYYMTILLPMPGKKVSDIVERMTEEWWKELNTKYVYSMIKGKEVVLSLPRFTVETKDEKIQNLKTVLSELGSPSMFNPEKAQFPNILTTVGLYVSQIIQKATIDVNEEGTIAAAITASTLDGESNALDILTPIYFTADHPFVYVISNMKTGVVYFIGTYQG